MATIFDSGNQKISTTNLPTIGKIVAASLLRPDESRNKILTTRSYETTPNEILAELEKISGEKWSVKHATCDEAAAKGKRQMKEGNYMGIVSVLRALVLDENNKYGGNPTNINTNRWVEKDKPMFEVLAEFYESF